MATRKNEIAMEGPAGGRPCMRTPEVFPVRTRFTTISRTCGCQMEDALKYSPAAAVPVSTKMPDPITAPIPSAVSDQGPKVFCSRCPGVSDSAISLSIDLQQKSWLSEVRTVAAGSVGDCDKSRLSPQSGIGHGPWWPIDGGRSMPGLLKPAVLAFRLAASQL